MGKAIRSMDLLTTIRAGTTGFSYAGISSAPRPLQPEIIRR
jgi:hypothetical protein